MGHRLPSLVVEWAMVFVILGKSVLVFFAKGPMKTGMFSVIRRKGEGVFSVLRMFGNNFGICDVGGSTSRCYPDT